jgi:hypothetical protein
MINYKLLYNRIFTSDKIMFSKDILFISNTNSYNEIDSYSKINFDDIISKNYSIIIVIDLFSTFLDDDVKNKIDYYKSFLTKNGKIIFIEQLLTNNDYDFLKIVKYITSPVLPILGKNIKMTHMYDIIKECGLYILDTDRLYSNDILFSSIEYFSIICEFH